ncbi:MAG: ribonuclease R [Candidatus Sumerlaeia bacterium]|nr:ribonuclease R [Candidatus Sumerlaeia bacterium]
MMIPDKEVIDYIVNSKAPVGVPEMLRKFRLKGIDRREFKKQLERLEQAGKVGTVGGKHYTTPSGRSGRIVGRLQVTSRGFGFLIPDWSGHDGAPPFPGDLFIPPRNMGIALDGDIVRAELLRSSDEGPTGRIVEVLTHAHTRVVGRYQQTGKKWGEVTPRNKRMDRRITVPVPPPSLGIKDFDWVETEIESYSSPPQPLEGNIISRIGEESDRGIDILLVLRDLGIMEEFPKSVEQEAKDLKFDWARDSKDRVDLRELPTITIDPATAKDFDDALSLERIQGGGFRLYVHIADVSHFVRPGSALDIEALERSTSVYPVDRVVPMLPEKISNFLCSLVPNEDRLTMTAEMEFSRAGKLLSKKVYSSIIHSDYRLTYEQAQEIIEAKAPEDAPFAAQAPLVESLAQLARLLRKKRFTRGALDLDIPEVNVVFDKDGLVSDLVFRESFEAHHLVEECMLIANESTAQLLETNEAPLLYRIHEPADETRLEKLADMLRVFGIQLHSGKGPISPKDVQAAIEVAQKIPAGHMVRRLVLRSMKRAEYSPENAGHFGLASKSYCHFTSPIRRYPDVIVHRQLKALESGAPLPYPKDDNNLEELGDHTSTRERRAQEAEWEAIAIKSLEFMKRFEGDEFDAFVGGVMNFGLFVELTPYPVEGLVHISQMRDDHYDLDESGVRLVGRRTGRVYRISDPIKVRILKIDPMGQQMDLAIVEDKSRAKPQDGARPPAKKGKKPFYKKQVKRRRR